MQSPVFSVITVVYNGKHLLQNTVESILSQEFTDYEYLLIDGGSTDGTVDLIAQYASKYPQIKWKSEKDKGLYDAMNKAIALAQGTYLWFINAGDQIASPTLMQEMYRVQLTQDIDVFYGSTLLISAQGDHLGLLHELTTRKLPRQLDWQNYLYGMRIVHQSFVPKRQLAPLYELGNLAADYKWCTQILKQAKRNYQITSGPMSKYLEGGVSKQRHLQSLKDRFKVMRTEFGLIPALYAHLIITLRALVHQIRRFGKPKF
jgi:glycosyltransferase involved in cell wall biosynthesis